MKLRTEIILPIRFGEEDHNAAYHGTSSDHARSHKSTIPAYPELLNKITADAFKSPQQAILPSKPFSHKYNQDGDDQEEGFHEQAEDMLLTDNQRPVSVPLSDGQVYDRTITNDMYTPAQQVGNALYSPTVSWDSIEPGLQLYIFENLLQQFQYPDIVGDLLSLSVHDLRRLAHIKNERALHPETTGALWDYCRSLGGCSKAYIEPGVLQEYRDSFAYAARFEDTSGPQRRLAAGFLKQHKIEGPFVDALLPSKVGIWVRPEQQDENRSCDMLTKVTKPPDIASNREDLDWDSFIANTFIHKSHNLNEVAPRHESSYPALLSSDCGNWQAVPADKLAGFENWLVYSAVNLAGENTASATDTFYGSALLSFVRQTPTVHELPVTFEQQEGSSSARARTVLADRESVQVLLHTAKCITSRKRLLRDQFDQSAVTPTKRGCISKLAQGDTNPAFVDNIRIFADRLLAEDQDSSSSPSSVLADQTETRVNGTPSICSSSGFVSPGGPGQSSSPVAGRDYSSATTPEAYDWNHGLLNNRTEMAPTISSEDRNALPSPSNAVRSTTREATRQMLTGHFGKILGQQDGVGGLIHHHAPPNASSLTALEKHNASPNVTCVQQAARGSPSPPPWSPLTENNDGQKARSSPAQPQSPADSFSRKLLTTIPVLARSRQKNSNVSVPKDGPMVHDDLREQPPTA